METWQRHLAARMETWQRHLAACLFFTIVGISYPLPLSCLCKEQTNNHLKLKEHEQVYFFF